MATVFVFGSNQQGRHGKGAALTARQKYGAEYGVGKGRTGNAYAIPTKIKPTYQKRQIPLEEIQGDVEEFLEYAQNHPEDIFLVTPIGTGLAGYLHTEIAPMFDGAPKNVKLPTEWTKPEPESGLFSI